MNIIKSSFISIALLTIPAVSSAQDKLLLSIDLIRHGDRVTSCSLPSDEPIQDLNLLTSKGKQESLALGKKLRTLYVNQLKLLPNQYQANSIYIRSTDAQRTIETARAIAEGLYPDIEIPIENVKINKVDLLIAKPDSHIRSIIRRYINQRNIWKSIQNNHHDKLHQWRHYSGLSLSNFAELDCLADNLAYKANHHLPLPTGINEKTVEEINTLDQSIILQDFQQNNFPNGDRFLQVVRSYAIEVIKHQTQLRYILFVGHDSSLLSVLKSLNVPIEHYPNFNARINFSLYEHNQSYYMKITYDDKIIRQGAFPLQTL